MEKYLPYIVTVLCSAISGFASFFAAHRQAKTEIQKLQKQHELDLEAEGEKFKMEKEKMELEHKQQMEQLTVQAGGQVKDRRQPPKKDRQRNCQQQFWCHRYFTRFH